MVFRLRVTLTGIKGFFRIYHVNGATTLLGRYGLFDLGSGTVDQVSLEKAVKAGATDFVYFYDVTNRKSVNITVEGEVEGAVVSPDSPFIAESKGPNPIEFENGYVAYEDLPDEQRHLPGENKGGLDFDDDEDFDDEEEEEEEEEDDDEDGKEIYDENE